MSKDAARAKLASMAMMMELGLPLDDEVQEWFVNCVNKFQSGAVATLDEAFEFNKLSHAQRQQFKYGIRAYALVKKLRMEDKKQWPLTGASMKTFDYVGRQLNISGGQAKKYYYEYEKQLASLHETIKL